MFLNTKIVTYSIFKEDFIGPVFIVPTIVTATNLETPFIFGLGVDIKLKKEYLALQYQDAYSIVIDRRNEFIADFTTGYRFVF